MIKVTTKTKKGNEVINIEKTYPLGISLLETEEVFIYDNIMDADATIIYVKEEEPVIKIEANIDDDEVIEEEKKSDEEEALPKKKSFKEKVSSFISDDKDKIYTVLITVNSKNFSLVLISFTKRSNCEALRDDVFKELKKAKDMEINDIEGQKFKLRYVFDTALRFDTKACLIDFNQKVNIDNKELLDSVLEEYSDQLSFIIKDKKVEVIKEASEKEDKSSEVADNEQVAELKDKEVREKTTNPVSKKEKFNVEKAFTFIELIKKHYVSFIFIGVFALLVSFVFYVIPYVLSVSNNTIVGGLFIAIGVITFFVEAYVLVSTYNLIISKEKNVNYIKVASHLAYFVVIGGLISLFLALILAAGNILLSFTNLTFVHMLAGIISTLLLIGISFLSPWILKGWFIVKRKCIDPLIKKPSKKENEKKDDK